MFEVLFTEQAAEGLYRFIDRYSDCFESLFRDSGIWAEAVIIQKYRIAARELNDRFIQEIQKKLSEETVFGRKRAGEWFEISFHVDVRLVVAYYSEDKEKKMRSVQWIGINQKNSF